LRGCGRSQKFYDPEHYHLDLAVEDLGQLLGLLQLESAILLGFSFGGRVALRFLDRYPAKVSKLILASSTAYENVANELEHWEEYQGRHNEAIREGESAIWHASSPSAEQRTRQLAELTLPLDIYHLDLLPLARQVIDRIDFSGEWMQAWQAGRLRGIQHADYAERLRAEGIPLLILHGEKDMRFPVVVAQRLAEHVPGARLTLLPQTGHLAHIEATEAWNAALLHFLFKS
jgi:pimeloyl-ACP methyl ester carboxylesterase